MLTMRGSFQIGFLVIAVSMLVAACTSRSTETVAPDSSEVAAWRPEQPGRVAVIVLGPADMMNREWFEFDPSVKKWLARGPTFTTIQGRRLVRNTYTLADAFRMHFDETSFALSRCTAGPLCIVGSVPLHIIGGLVLWTVGERRYVQPPPRVQSLESTRLARIVPAVEDLDKNEFVRAVAEAVARLRRQRTDHEFTLMPFDKAANHWSRPRGFDAELTVRVTSVGLTTSEERDPRAHLEFHVWTNLNNTGSRGWEHVSEPRELSAWTSNNASQFREDLDHAIGTIAEQIVDESFAAK